jgi:hypothetical protein
MSVVEIRPAGPADFDAAKAMPEAMSILPLEHLVSVARNNQITMFTAKTLTENQAMLDVIAAAGLPSGGGIRRGSRDDISSSSL